MILYALKSGDDYLKKTNDVIERVNIQKASVFASMNEVVDFRKIAENDQFEDLHFMQLELTEKEILL